jgi:hypothetical protein
LSAQERACASIAALDAARGWQSIGQQAASSKRVSPQSLAEVHSAAGAAAASTAEARVTLSGAPFWGAAGGADGAVEAAGAVASLEAVLQPGAASASEKPARSAQDQSGGRRMEQL